MGVGWWCCRNRYAIRGGYPSFLVCTRKVPPERRLSLCFISLAFRSTLHSPLKLHTWYTPTLRTPPFRSSNFAIFLCICFGVWIFPLQCLAHSTPTAHGPSCIPSRNPKSANKHVMDSPFPCGLKTMPSLSLRLITAWTTVPQSSTSCGLVVFRPDTLEGRTPFTLHSVVIGQVGPVKRLSYIRIIAFPLSVRPSTSHCSAEALHPITNASPFIVIQRGVWSTNAVLTFPFDFRICTSGETNNFLIPSSIFSKNGATPASSVKRLFMLIAIKMRRRPLAACSFGMFIKWCRRASRDCQSFPM